MPDAPTVPGTGPPPAPTPRLRVLAIDDERLIGDIIGRALAAHDVTCFRRAAEALAAIHGGARFDAILCDVMMPQLDGIGFYRALVECAPDQAARLVFMTGGVSTPGAEKALDALARPRLDKPINLRVLRTTIVELAGQ